jgi:pilus assembly protein CpaF
MWSMLISPLVPEQREQVVTAVCAALKGISLTDLRNREIIYPRALQAVQNELTRLGLQAPNDDMQAMARDIAARVGGLGFLEPMLRLDSGYSEIAVNPDGSVWVIAKGEQDFVRLGIRPNETDVWRAVETLLAPLQRAVSEASPSVDAKIPRSPALPGGARLKILHPVIAPGDGYPSINIRLFEPKPVPPEKIIEWSMAPEWVVQKLVEYVALGMRILVIGGTASGKTTLLSALANGIPATARVVKIEDPEEIWLAQPDVVSIEARPAQVGSTVPAYTLANGVDDAMRMSPRWLIVGEMRRGDAINALFRAQMSDHPGLSTFHAESPEAMVKRMTAMLWADANVQAAPAKELIAEAIDVVVQVGFRDLPSKSVDAGEGQGNRDKGDAGDASIASEGQKRRRRILGAWSVNKELKAGNVGFTTLYHLPGDDEGRAGVLNRLEKEFLEAAHGSAVSV